MKPSKFITKFRLLSFTMLAPLFILTACGSGGGSSTSTGVTNHAAALVSSNTNTAAVIASSNPPAGHIFHATITTIASTVPANGDVNPYGVARVEQTAGKLKAGHILVSNFNNSANLQGTGSTIVEVAPDGSVDLFTQI